MENKTLLLTGSSGFIGRHVLDSLINKGYDVTAIYNSSIPSGFDNVKFVKLNLFDFSAVKEYFENNHFDNLIHLAWYTGKKCHSSNVNIDWVSASLNLLKCFNEQVDNTKTSDNKRKVLMAGTVSEYDFSYGYLTEGVTPLNNPSLYGKCKASLYKMAEQYSKQNGIEFKWARIFNKVKDNLQDFDYAFFFNGNMEVIREVTEEELLPTEKDGYIVAPLHSCNKRVKSNYEFDYERNNRSTSYIPYGEGKYYFHAGLIGGRVKETLEMFDICEKMMDEDIAQNYIPKFHDESVFNKYVLNRPYKILSNYYIHPTHGKPFVKLNPKVKIIQRDKSKFKYGGHDYLRGDSPNKITLPKYIMEKIKQKLKIK